MQDLTTTLADLKNECVKACQKSIQDITDNIVQDYQTRIKSLSSLAAVEVVNGDGLYDYSDFKDVDVDSILKDAPRHNINTNKNAKIDMNNFNNPGERIVIWYMKAMYYRCRNGNNPGCIFPDQTLIFISNYGNVAYLPRSIYSLDISHITLSHNIIDLAANNKLNIAPNVWVGDNTQNLGTFYYHIHNFKLPVDYINLIKSTIPNVYELNEFLYTAKHQLYNRKFIPLYISDIIKQNDMLTKKYAEIELFEKNKLPYDKLEQELINVKKERDAIEAEKNKLKLIKLKLDAKEQAVNDKLAKLNNIDLDDLLSTN